MSDSSWLTAAGVRSTMGLRPGEAVDDAALQKACNAAAEYVEGIRPEHWTEADPEADPPVVSEYVPGPMTLQGAAMLAHRWYARRASPLGIIGYAEQGTAGILRFDPDIAKLLKIGTEGKFVFGAPTPVVEEA